MTDHCMPMLVMGAMALLTLLLHAGSVFLGIRALLAGRKVIWELNWDGSMKELIAGATGQGFALIWKAARVGLAEVMSRRQSGWGVPPARSRRPAVTTHYLTAGERMRLRSQTARRAA